MFTKKLHVAGARSVIICDTKGQYYPNALHKLFETIREYDQRRIEFHPHNDKENSLDNIRVAE